MIRRPASLTRQLALLYAAIAAASFAAAGLYLHQSFAAELERQDDIELIGKVELVRHMLSEFSSPEALRRDTHLIVDAMVGHRGLLLDIRSADDRTIVAGAVAAKATAAVPIGTAQTPTLADIRNSTTVDGAPARTISALGRVGSHPQGDDVTIVLVNDRSGTIALLRSYRNRMLAAGTGGALLAGLLGFMVVSRGLRPLTVLATKAAQINIAHLDQRPQLAGGPSELHELVGAFNRMLDRVEEGVTRLSRFSSDLAHELRTPITVLLGETQVALTRQRSPAEYQAILASNVEELERLSRIVNDMLFLATVEDSKIALQRRQLDFGEELQKIAEFLEDLAAEHGLTITVEGDGTGSADPALLRRAVTNVVVNAIGHSLPNGVITLSVSRLSDAVAVTVHNIGPAIPSELQERIFERFFRGDRRRIAGPSFGLGLAIVQSIVHLHGGDVSVISSHEHGTTFRLVFPERATA